MKKLILIVEDDARTQEMYANDLKDLPVSIISAYTLKEAQELFSNTEHIDLIIMDGNIEHEYEIDSPPLILIIRQTYKGPIIAASRSEEYREKMMAAGCDYESEKDEAATLAKQILGL